MVSIDDLVAAGLYDPVQGAARTSVSNLESDDRGGVTVELARALARVAALEEVVARQDEELRFLRQLMSENLGKAAR